MPALQQSNWPQSSDFWANIGQHHAPSPLERRPYDTQPLDNVADKYRHKCLTALLRDCFNRQEQTYRRIASHQDWSGDDAEHFRAKKKKRRYGYEGLASSNHCS